MRKNIWFKFLVILLFTSLTLLGCGKSAEKVDQSLNNQKETNETTKNNEDNNSKVDDQDSSNETQENITSNDYFILESPTLEQVIGKTFIVKGKARGVFEGDFLYEFEDGHSLLSQGYIMVKVGNDPSEWAEFEHIINLEKNPTNPMGTLILYEENAENGSRINTLIISFEFDPAIVKGLDN